MPPYITSFQNGSSASWNEVNFVGRPEALYTYNNSKRTGSVSFFVLTDFASKVDIGLDKDMSFPESFSTISKLAELDAQIKDVDKKIEENAKLQQSAATGESAKLKKKGEKLETKKAKIQKDRAKSAENETAGSNGYSESSKYTKNVYQDIIGGPSNVSGDIVSTIAETEARLVDMKKNLKFQPSFFSGDKVDFLHRIEFLEKMVRPSRKGGPGFSFLNPPVCHMHLGDWFNHDIIVESIDYDYTDAPWTLDGLSGKAGRVQPMWTQVTMSFIMIGRYKHGAGDALTSTDKGGFFSPGR